MNFCILKREKTSFSNFEKDEKAELKAIIDFGDVCHSLFMFDLAICLIYMMVAAKVQNVSTKNSTHCEKFFKGDMYAVMQHVVSGYQAVRKLSADEGNSLFYLLQEPQ